MSHVFFALFPSQEHASDAIAAVLAQGVPEDHFSVLAHADAIQDTEELMIAETDGQAGVAGGAVLGALSGMLAMTVLAIPTGLIGVGTMAVAAMGATMGGALGALGAGLAGLSLPDKDLDRLLSRLEAGCVLVTVRVAKRTEVTQIVDVFHRHGAVEAHKHAF